MKFSHSPDTTKTTTHQANDDKTSSCISTILRQRIAIFDDVITFSRGQYKEYLILMY